MILVDTSVWVDHLRTGDTVLATRLKQGAVFTHPFVIGEIGCGRLKNHKELLGLLHQLPMVSTATDAEALRFIETHELMARESDTSTSTCSRRSRCPLAFNCGRAIVGSRWSRQRWGLLNPDPDSASATV